MKMLELTISKIRITYCKFTEGAKFINNIMDGYSDDKDFYETPEDLFDLLKILDNYVQERTGEVGLIELNQMRDFLMAAEFICKPEDLLEMAYIKDFNTKYPRIFNTMCIWAWG